MAGKHRKDASDSPEETTSDDEKSLKGKAAAILTWILVRTGAAMLLAAVKHWLVTWL
jgi:hypothetical protein